MVLRPGSKIRTTTVSSRRGEVHAPLSLVARPSPYHRSPRHHSRPSRSRRGWRAASCGCRGGTAGGAGPPDGNRQRAPRPTTTAANQLRPTARPGRRSPPGAVKSSVPPDGLLPRAVGCAHVASPGFGGGAGACCTDPIVCPDVLGGGDIGQRDRVERPEAGLGQVRRGRAQAVGSSAGVIRRAWSLLPAFPIQPRRD
jgi:hypothetical protein